MRGQRHADRKRGRLNQSAMRDSREHESGERRGVGEEIKVDERTPLLPQFRAAPRATDKTQRHAALRLTLRPSAQQNTQNQIVEITCDFESKHRCHGTQTTGDDNQRAGRRGR